MSSDANEDMDAMWKERAEKAEEPGGIVPVKDFANIYGVTPGRMIQMIRSGQVPGLKLNGRWFVRISQLGREQIEAQKKLDVKYAE